jgi:hypothetical protein
MEKPMSKDEAESTIAYWHLQGDATDVRFTIDELCQMIEETESPSAYDLANLRQALTILRA